MQMQGRLGANHVKLDTFSIRPTAESDYTGQPWAPQTPNALRWSTGRLLDCESSGVNSFTRPHFRQFRKPSSFALQIVHFVQITIRHRQSFDYPYGLSNPRDV